MMISVITVSTASHHFQTVIMTHVCEIDESQEYPSGCLPTE